MDRPQHPVRLVVFADSSWSSSPLPRRTYPILVMAYGIGLTSKVFVVCIMAMPVIVLNTAGAVRNTPGFAQRDGALVLGQSATSS